MSPTCRSEVPVHENFCSWRTGLAAARPRSRHTISERPSSSRREGLPAAREDRRKHWRVSPRGKVTDGSVTSQGALAPPASLSRVATGSSLDSPICCSSKRVVSALSPQFGNATASCYTRPHCATGTVVVKFRPVSASFASSPPARHRRCDCASSPPPTFFHFAGRDLKTH